MSVTVHSVSLDPLQSLRMKTFNGGSPHSEKLLGLVISKEPPQFVYLPL